MTDEEIMRQIIKADEDDLLRIVKMVKREVAKDAVDCCYRVHRTRGTPPDCARAITARLLDA